MAMTEQCAEQRKAPITRSRSQNNLLHSRLLDELGPPQVPSLTRTPITLAPRQGRSGSPVISPSASLSDTSSPSSQRSVTPLRNLGSGSQKRPSSGSRHRRTRSTCSSNILVSEFSSELPSDALLSPQTPTRSSFHRGESPMLSASSAQSFRSGSPSFRPQTPSFRAGSPAAFFAGARTGSPASPFNAMNMGTWRSPHSPRRNSTADASQAEQRPRSLSDGNLEMYLSVFNQLTEQLQRAKEVFDDRARALLGQLEQARAPLSPPAGTLSESQELLLSMASYSPDQEVAAAPETHSEPFPSADGDAPELPLHWQRLWAVLLKQARIAANAMLQLPLSDAKAGVFSRLVGEVQLLQLAWPPLWPCSPAVTELLIAAGAVMRAIQLFADPTDEMLNYMQSRPDLVKEVETLAANGSSSAPTLFETTATAYELGRSVTMDAAAAQASAPPNVFIELSINGIIRYVSKSAGAWFGPAELIGTNGAQLMTPESFEVFQAALGRLVASTDEVAEVTLHVHVLPSRNAQTVLRSVQCKGMLAVDPRTSKPSYFTFVLHSSGHSSASNSKTSINMDRRNSVAVSDDSAPDARPMAPMDAPTETCRLCDRPIFLPLFDRHSDACGRMYHAQRALLLNRRMLQDQHDSLALSVQRLAQRDLPTRSCPRDLVETARLMLRRAEAALKLDASSLESHLLSIPPTPPALEAYGQCDSDSSASSSMDSLTLSPPSAPSSYSDTEESETEGSESDLSVRSGMAPRRVARALRHEMLSLEDTVGDRVAYIRSIHEAVGDTEATAQRSQMLARSNSAATASAAGSAGSICSGRASDASTAAMSPTGSNEGPSVTQYLPLTESFRALRAASTVAPRIQDFEVVKPISQGAFGRVFLARHTRSQDYFAVKVLRKADMVEKNQMANVHREQSIMTAVDCPYVVPLVYSFQSTDSLYLVMEYMNGGDCASLLKSLGALDEEWARSYAAEVVLALEYLHARGIVHRDLKPDNLLIDAKGHLKLADFGLSKLGFLGRKTNLDAARAKERLAEAAGDNSLAQFVGTPDYVAPEAILGQVDGLEVDWWALGVILYEFLYGVPPFNAATVQDIFRRIVTRDIVWDGGDDVVISPQARDIMERLLCLEPARRLGARGADEVKAHPFFDGVPWETLRSQPASFIPRTSSIEDTTFFDERGVSVDAAWLAEHAAMPDQSSSSSSSSSNTSSVGATRRASISSATSTSTTSPLHSSPSSASSSFLAPAIVPGSRARASSDAAAPTPPDFTYKNVVLLDEANRDVARRISMAGITHAAAAAAALAHAARTHSNASASSSASSSSSSTSLHDSASGGNGGGMRPRHNSLPSNKQIAFRNMFNRLRPAAAAAAAASAAASASTSAPESPATPPVAVPRGHPVGSPPSHSHSPPRASRLRALFSSSSSQSTSEMRTRRALIVDGNPVTSKIMSTILSRAGFNCAVVSSPSTAVKLAVGATPYHICFMDISSANQGGVAAATLIRSVEGVNKFMPIIATTPHEKHIALGNRFEDILGKPFSKEEVLEKVRRWA